MIAALCILSYLSRHFCTFKTIYKRCFSFKGESSGATNVSLHHSSLPFKALL